MQNIRKICVIGSGVMGSAIAAQISNAKIPVLLLDVKNEKLEEEDPDFIVNNGLSKALKAKPEVLSSPGALKFITTGNIQDNLSEIKEYDLIIEAIIENFDTKVQLYKKVVLHMHEKALLASNTSTITLKKFLSQDVVQKLGTNFLITHFFNPPRYMELVEVIFHEDIDSFNKNNVICFLEGIGKVVVLCQDSPGFIANRVGCFLLELVVRDAIRKKISIQEIDWIFSTYLGFPSSGIFGLYDLIGHDVMEQISKSLLTQLPKDDLYHKIYENTPLIHKMKEYNLIGKKSKGGFYRKNSKKQLEVLNIDKFEYQSLDEKNMLKLQAKLKDSSGELFLFVEYVLNTFFEYINQLIPKVTTKQDILDLAMKLGYNMKYGPFQLMSFFQKKEENVTKKTNISYENLTQIEQLKEKYNYQNFSQSYEVILSNSDAEFITSKGRFLFKILTKMNSLTNAVFLLLQESLEYIKTRSNVLYIISNDICFSSGANLNFIKSLSQKKQYSEIEAFLSLGQETMQKLKYGDTIIVSCALGYALGGGCELLLHSDKIIAHQNLVAGLVEVSLGLIPSFGGTKEMFLRSKGKIGTLVNNLENILLFKKTTSSDYFSVEYGVDVVTYLNKQKMFKDIFELEETKLKKRNKILKVNTFKMPKIDLGDYLNLKSYNSVQNNIATFFQNIIDQKILKEQALLDFEKYKFLELVKRAFAYKS